MASKHQTRIMKEMRDQGYYVINLIKTNLNGIPDLLGLKDGEPPWFVESKEYNDTLKVLQAFRIKELRGLGFRAEVSKASKPAPLFSPSR